MQEIVVTCGQCERPLRVPEEMLGRLVKCPACGFTFTATSSPPPADVPRADFEPASSLTPSEDTQEASRHRARRAVLAPAICLLLTGVLGVLASTWGVLIIHLRGPEQQRADAMAMIENLARALNMPMPPDELGRHADAAVQVTSVIQHGSLMLSLIVCIAAVQMLRLRTHWLTVTGGILAMINIASCCCVLGLPFGIWSLVVLFRPDVKNLFAS